MAATWGAGTHLEVVGDAGLTSEQSAGADPDRPGEATLGRQDRAGADLDIVADLDQVIELGSAADDCGAEGRAVDCGQSADIDVVLDHDAADLGHPPWGPLVVDEEAKPGAADNRTWTEPDPVAEQAAVQDHGSGAEAAVVAEGGTLGDHRSWAELAAGPDHGVGADPAEGADPRCRVDLGARFDHSGPVDPGLDLGLRVELVEEASEGEPRGGMDPQRPVTVVAAELLVGEQRRGAGLSGSVGIPTMEQRSELTVFSLGE